VELTGPDGDHWINVPWTLCADNAEVLAPMPPCRGGASALLPTFIAGADLQNGRLRTILTDYKAPEISLYAVYPQTRHLSVQGAGLRRLPGRPLGGRPYWIWWNDE